MFKPELGLITGTASKIHIDPSTPPKFFKARPVPYALPDHVDKAIDQLEQAGVIQPVKHSDWASPVVPVVKQDGSIRLCGDYKITVNKTAKLDSYPLPRIDDLFSSLQVVKNSPNWIWHMRICKYPWKKTPRNTQLSIHTEVCTNIPDYLLVLLQLLLSFNESLKASFRVYLTHVFTSTTYF